MRVYDDERRAVAENLRNEALHGRVGYLEQFRDRLADTLLIDRATYADMFDRLADLVEPGPERTCRLESIPYEPGCYEGPRCSVCHTVDLDMGEGPYCSGCGARIERGDEG